MKRSLLVSRLVVVFSLAAVACSDDDSSVLRSDGGNANGGTDAAVDMAFDVASVDAPPRDSAASDVSARDGASDVGASDVGADAPPCKVAPTAEATAKLRVTCDDFVSIYFNGALVDAPTSLWTTLKEYDVKLFLYPQKRNVIALECRNAYEQGGLDRGLIAELVYTGADQTKYVKTDSTWRASATAPANWTALDYNDSAWATATSLGASGISPWSNVFPNSGAEWLWTYVPSGDPAAKPDEEKNYFRKVFFMDTNGAASDVQPVCE